MKLIYCRHKIINPSFIRNIVTDNSSFNVCYFFTLIRAQFHLRSTYSFYACRSRKRKKIPMTWLYFFTLSGATGVKAIQRTLMKSTPGWRDRIKRQLFGTGQSSFGQKSWTAWPFTQIVFIIRSSLSLSGRIKYQEAGSQELLTPL